MAVLRPTGSTTRIPSMVGPAGYAQPDRPIHVTFVGDEEIFAESHVPSREKVTVPPPAYGLWRSSVRINPDLLYWQRVEGHPPLPESFNRAGNSYGKPRIPRPPSYTSDDGIDYVVEVQPRSLTQFRSPEEQNQRR
ncbi:hypothetical protein ARAM_004948 [Aspergillus rambellii]|uniref:Uncharacterized protein n=3 Tax=Aspergillus subgen. Nidulantes TaxID=2720870 RepID=A0A0F8UJW3_9EURO|nr:hypothetical protein AOCH_004724 [Aspergillus ochraceoroseus]KKK19838.1 hypothetical protein ARAM_004948 [Aspergillus rambellii]